MRIAAVASVLVALAQIPDTQAAEPSPNESQNGLLESSRALRDNPQLRERMHDQQLQEQKDLYGDFVKEQRLSAQQTQRFYEILTDYAVEDFIGGAERMENFGAESAATAAPNSGRAAKMQQEMQLLLGDMAMARLKEYQKLGSERMILAQFRYELRRSDVALSDVTARSLFELICEEKARMKPLAFDPRDASRNDLRVAMEGNNAQEYYEAEEALNRRILSRAGAVLNQDQYAEFAKFVQRHLAAEKAGIEALHKIMQQPPAEAPEE